MKKNDLKTLMGREEEIIRELAWIERDPEGYLSWKKSKLEVERVGIRVLLSNETVVG